MHSYLNSLNDNQRAAVTAPLGPAIVIAGPGSGKTKVILSRLFYLTDVLHIDASEILTISFTRASCDELRGRIRSFPFYHSEKHEVLIEHVYTFHALFLKSLKEFHILSDSAFATEWDKQKLLYDAVLKINRMNQFDTHEKFLEFAQDFLHEVSRYKNLQGDFHQDMMEEEEFLVYFDAFDSEMKRAGKADYDDFALLLLNELRSNAHLKAKLRSKYSYILIDEFQDINPIQYDIIRLMLNENRNIMVVGDDDQAIYAFRGAANKCLLGFKEDFRNVKEYYLNQNYRSDRNIVKTSLRLIQNNQNRVKKELNAVSNEPGDIQYRSFENSDFMYEDILSLLKELKGSIGILTRTNYEKEKLRALVEEKLPSYYNTEEVEALSLIYHFLQYAQNHSRRELLFCLKYIPEVTRSMLREPLVEPLSLLENTYKCPFIQDTVAGILWALAYVRKGNMILDAAVILDCFYGTDDLKFRKRILEIVAGLKDENELEHIVSGSKERLPIYVYHTEYNTVSILTAHASKGLEFDAVILPNVNEGNYPKKSRSMTIMEEERRLFYVALTRARHNLFLYYIKNSSRKPDVSHFIKDMSEETKTHEI